MSRRITQLDRAAWDLLKRATPKQIALASGDRRRGGVEVSVAEAWRALEWLVDCRPRAPNARS